MAVHKCVVLYSKSLLAQGLAHLLRTDEDVEVTLANTEQVDPMAAISSANPEVLILDMNNFEELSGVLARLLRECPSVKILCLDPLESTMYILRPRQRVLGSAQEFLATVWEDI